MTPYLDDGDVRLYHGDCVEVMAAMEAESVDAVVCDPPYALSFMGREWDDTLPGQHVWEEALRVLRPGGHLLAFGGTRTFHRLTCAIEDAGFEIRDCLMWLYGSGFPKSLDVSKAIDKAVGAEREVVGSRTLTGRAAQSTRDKGGTYTTAAQSSVGLTKDVDITAPATPEAVQWQGWGTALKPAWEPVVVARRPIAGTVAANVLEFGTGALNIDGCRVGEETTVTLRNGNSGAHGRYGRDDRVFARENPPGRWPANLVLDEDAAAMLDGAVGERRSPATYMRNVRAEGNWLHAKEAGTEQLGYSDSGGPSRFFYTAKASSVERDGSKHPTVKPLALMRWLVRLVMPLGGLVLDPFAGSGTTLLAAREEGFRAVGIEREEEYAKDVANRLRQLSLLGGVA